MTFENEVWRGMFAKFDRKMKPQAVWNMLEADRYYKRCYEKEFYYDNNYPSMMQSPKKNYSYDNSPPYFPKIPQPYPAYSNEKRHPNAYLSKKDILEYPSYENKISQEQHPKFSSTETLSFVKRKHLMTKSPDFDKCTEDTQLPCKKSRKKYNFTSNDVNTVLYGYIKDEDKSKHMLHSLSGISSRPHPRDAISSRNLQLPSSLIIDSAKVGDMYHVGVFAKIEITKGKLFGPYTGTLVKTNKTNTDCEDCWEVFEENCHVKILDGSTQQQNWMRHVNTARYQAEQNLSLIQIDSELYYKVSVDIQVGKELLVWYGADHVKFMDIPCSYKSTSSSPVSSTKDAIPVKDAVSGNFPCDRCGKIFSYEYYRDKHLKYTRCVDMGDRKFPCHLCQRSFEKKDRLRIHILHVHQKYRPHVCNVCGKRFSQSSSLNKHSRVHTGERPYQCPHCPKSFTASSILRTHLRQHNGERPFKCKFCSKAFASHAAHDSHVKRTHEQLKKFICKICKKSFSMEFELTFHVSTHTTEELNSLHNLFDNNNSIATNNVM